MIVAVTIFVSVILGVAFAGGVAFALASLTEIAFHRWRDWRLLRKR